MTDKRGVGALFVPVPLAVRREGGRERGREGGGDKKSFWCGSRTTTSSDFAEATCCCALGERDPRTFFYVAFTNGRPPIISGWASLDIDTSGTNPFARGERRPL